MKVIRTSAAVITVSRKSRLGAAVLLVINGKRYLGKVSNPNGANAPDQWISSEIIRGLSSLPCEQFTEACKAIRAEIQ